MQPATTAGGTSTCLQGNRTNIPGELVDKARQNRRSAVALRALQRLPFGHACRPPLGDQSASYRVRFLSANEPAKRHSSSSNELRSMQQWWLCGAYLPCAAAEDFWLGLDSHGTSGQDSGGRRVRMVGAVERRRARQRRRVGQP